MGDYGGEWAPPHSKGGGKGPPMDYGGAWAPPQWTGGGNMYGGQSPMDVDGSTSKLHKRVQWMGDNENFEKPLDFQKVAEAAAGLDSTMQMKVLKDLQEKKDTVRDPTSYVTAAYRKVGGGSKGGGKGPPTDYGGEWGKGGGKGPPMDYGGEWAPPQWTGGGDMYGGQSPMDVDGSNSKLHKRGQWLNETEAFEKPLDFQKVAEEAAG